MVRVAGIVLHRGGDDAYLAHSVGSLLRQRRPLDAIVVAHDGTGAVPAWLRSKFPAVEVLTARTPARPAAVVQQVIASTPADAFLLQASTAWSAPDRLELLLEAAARCGAGLVGSDLVVVDPLVPDARRGNASGDGAAAGGPGAVDARTMLVERALVERLGGFNTALPVAAADELVVRAAAAGCVAHVPRPLYFHRPPDGSAGSAGLRERVALAALGERSRQHAVAIARGQPPDVRLQMHRDLVELERVDDGPHELVLTPAPHRPPASDPASEADAPPVFVVGASASLARFVACLLGQHSRLAGVDVTEWITEVARAAARFVGGAQHDEATVSAVCRAAGAAVDALFAGEPPAGRWVGALPTDRLALLSAALLYPDATFVHVLRPVDQVVATELATDGGLDVDDAYRGWLANTRVILDVFQLLDTRRIDTVRYDALVDDPDAEIERLLRRLGEPFEPACTDVMIGTGAGGGRRTIPDLAGAPAQLDARRLSLALTGVSAAGDRERTRLLVKALASEPPRSARPAPLTPPAVGEDDRNPYRRSHDLVRRSAPGDAIVCVVSKGDEMAVRIRGHAVGWHFPQTDDGAYLGYHPRESHDAIAHLEALRARGAQLFLIPPVYGWWLLHYVELRQHLERTYRRVPSTEEEGTLFDLRAGPEPAALAGRAAVAP